MRVEYQHNEWLCVYTDECGDRQIMPFDTFEQADGYAKSLREQFVNVIGVMATSFYDAHVEKVIEEKPSISDELLKLMWDTVNSAQPDNLDALQEAEQKIDKMFDEVQFDAEIYDELMNTLAYKTREYYKYFNKNN